MTRRRAMAALTLVLSFSAANLGAQVRVVRSGDDRLTGIGEVDVLVERVGPLVKGCDTNLHTLKIKLLDALGAARIKATISEKARSWPYSVVITIQTERAPAACATALWTELVAEVSGLPEADNDRPPGRWGSMLIGAMPLTRERALVIVAPEEHDAAVQKAILTHTTAIAARVRAANP